MRHARWCIRSVTDNVPSYEVMDQHRQSCILHQNQLLLFTPETGIPLCVGICQAHGTDVPAPPQLNQLPIGSDDRDHTMKR